jgi:hypothetical protein
MKEILKYSKANVCIKDEEGKILFADSNLFVDSGRELIAKIFRGDVADAALSTKIACDLGDDATNSAPDQLDLINFTNSLAAGATIVSYPEAPTGVHFQFTFTAAGDTIIRELGLFYRPDSDSFPTRGSDPPTMTGTMIARLKTTLSSITVADTRTITIDWKIIF